MHLKISEADAKVIRRQMDKLKPSSRAMLSQMLKDGEAVVDGDKIRIRDGYESKALAFQFK